LQKNIELQANITVQVGVEMNIRSAPSSGFCPGRRSTTSTTLVRWSIEAIEIFRSTGATFYGCCLNAGVSTENAGGGIPGFRLWPATAFLRDQRSLHST
jgi:hypothetical protein